MESKSNKQTKQNKNRLPEAETMDSYQTGGNAGMEAKGKGNAVNNIVMTADHQN